MGFHAQPAMHVASQRKGLALVLQVLCLARLMHDHVLSKTSFRQTFCGRFLMNIRHASLAIALVFAMPCGNAFGDEENIDSTQLHDMDKAFLDAAASADHAEIELSKVALAKTRTPAIRTFAQQMIADHGKNYLELQTLCRNKKYAIAPELDADHRTLLRKLNSANSDDGFDRAYLDATIADHMRMDALLDRAANNSNDSDIKRYSANTSLIVKKHEQMAQDLVAK
ncbi:DUF4142 domain-containing protein [Pseudolysobacter antarcticus]|uniref:DUF4142 domain-containing protein n=1 Tax=Pseudolysobacter antarcticus TaxID=2511995 RepID=A0A411HJD4_9GAMM|nr:DUF4142 domain-containing protein [Pseudolysobacter antarcticus]QBB70608.1 DUF4142 domain-containing protein [Pseudolysobacter antarcticus]